MRQCGSATRRVANGKIVVVDHHCPEIDRLGGALFDAGASCSGRLVKRLNAGVSLVGWARGPFPVSGVRRDSGHTYTGHCVLLSTWPMGRCGGTAPRGMCDEEGWPQDA